MSSLYIPKGYQPKLDALTTEKAIRKIKDDFQANLAFELDLQRAPRRSSSRPAPASTTTSTAPNAPWNSP